MARLACLSCLGALLGCGEVVSMDGAADGGGPLLDAADAGTDNAVDASDARPRADAHGTADGPDAPDAPVIRDASSQDVSVIDGSATVRTCAAPVPPAPVCGAAVCGNGAIDNCQGQCVPAQGGPYGYDAGASCQTLYESCDGANLGGASCTSLGYAGGVLRCNASCGYDVSGCDHCGTNASILACTTAVVDGSGATDIALATSATAIGLAWTAGAQGHGGGLHVAVLGPDLSVLHQTSCLGAGDVWTVAMAATPSGWLVAAQGQAGISLYPLLADGTPAGTAQIIAGATAPLLASNPTGGPLLVWVSPDGTAHASLLGPNGSVGATVPILASTIETEYGSAVYTSGSFLVAIRGNGGATVVRVGLDASVGTAHSLGASTEYPQLAWTGSEARVVYADFSSSGKMQFARLDSTGAPLGSPVTLGAIPTYYDPAPIVTVGTDTVGLLPGYTGETDFASHLDVARVAPDGLAVHSPYVLAQGGTVDGLTRYHLAMRGPDVIAAWLATSRSLGGPDAYPGAIGIARVSP